MSRAPRVSVLMPFLNPGRFFEAAIDSVLAQSFGDWELLLVDDGSTDGSSTIGLQAAAAHPDRIRYIEHPGHRNLGILAAGRLALRHVQGEFLALLDADDVWLPRKLENHVPLLEAAPKAVMLYGQTLYWHGWTGRADDSMRDWVPDLGMAPGTLVHPPELLTRYLQRTAAVPCTCSILARTEAVRRARAFEGDFIDLYTDQVFYARMILEGPVLLVAGWAEKYRRHPGSSWSRAQRSGKDARVRAKYLDWLALQLEQRGIRDAELQSALRYERQKLEHRWVFGLLERVRALPGVKGKFREGS